MSAKEKAGLEQSRQAATLRELEQLRSTEKLLTQVLARLTISVSGLNASLDPLLTQLLTLLRKGEGIGPIQADVERISEALFRIAVAELEKRKNGDSGPETVLKQAPPDSASEPYDRYALLFSFVKSRLENGEEIAALNDLQARLQSDTEIKETELFEALEQCLESILDSRPQATTPENSGKEGILTRLFGGARKTSNSALVLPAIQKNLSALLNAIDIPLALQAKANILNAKLKGHLELEALLEVFQETVTFLAGVKQEAQREEKYLEDFLHELTGKLAELERQTVGVQALTLATGAGAAEMRATFQDHVDELKLSTSGATDLDTLKSVLNQRFESIATYLSAEREEEEQRQKETETQMALLSARLQEMEEETAQLRSVLRVQHNLAVRDPLTGLPNRLAYDERITQEIKHFKRYGTSFCLLVWDIDHFKGINDRFGHKAGDKALVTIAEKLSAEIRETDFVGRFGGEEFVMILAGTRNDAAFAVAEGIRREIVNCGFNSHGKPVAITISCGITQFHEDDTPDQVFERADSALYRAKREGRNRCIVAE